MSSSRKKRKLRVVVLMHEDLIPPDHVEVEEGDEFMQYKTEYDVVVGLRELGHEVVKLGLSDEIAPLRKIIKGADPHIVFNLLEEFRGEAVYDQNVVAYMELQGVHYTGCNPRGLVIARDKALSKKILHYHRIRVPRFMVVQMGRKPRRNKQLEFPLIVKSLVEESSAGISQASVVYSDEKLAERVCFMHENVGTDAIVEQYIDGREVYVGVLGNSRLEVLPVWELEISNLPADAPRIATRRVKWDIEYQEKHKITSGRARDLTPEKEAEIAKVSRRIYRLLGLSGYARIDFRLTPEGSVYFLEANPNPDIAIDEEFASAAEATGCEYPQLMEKIVAYGLKAGRLRP